MSSRPLPAVRRSRKSSASFVSDGISALHLTYLLNQKAQSGMDEGLVEPCAAYERGQSDIADFTKQAAGERRCGAQDAFGNREEIIAYFAPAHRSGDQFNRNLRPPAGRQNEAACVLFCSPDCTSRRSKLIGLFDVSDSLATLIP